MIKERRSFQKILPHSYFLSGGVSLYTVVNLCKKLETYNASICHKTETNLILGSFCLRKL